MFLLVPPPCEHVPMARKDCSLPLGRYDNSDDNSAYSLHLSLDTAVTAVTRVIRSTIPAHNRTFRRKTRTYDRVRRWDSTNYATLSHYRNLSDIEGLVLEGAASQCSALLPL